MRRTVLGAGLVAALLAIVAYSAAHGAILGVILAAPPAILFALAVIDNQLVYPRRQRPADEQAADGPARPDGVG
jgi:hypothetical protein